MEGRMEGGEVLLDGTMLTMRPGDLVLVYAVISNTDLNSGKGSDKSIGYFWGYDEACRFGRGRGVMGGDCSIREEHGVIDVRGRVWVGGQCDVAVGGSFDRAVAWHKARGKLAACLTTDEYELLGITHLRPRVP